MTPAERREMIADYGAAGDRLADASMQFPKEMWTYKPGPDRWSIHEILVHIADSEVNSYVRCRRFIAVSTLLSARPSQAGPRPPAGLAARARRDDPFHLDPILISGGPR
jgi:transposase